MLTDRERALTGPRSQKSEGSTEWCWQTIYIFKEALRHVKDQYRQAEEVMEELKQAKAWKKVPPEAPYGSFDAMLQAETGMSARQLSDHIKTAREKYGAVKKASPHGANQHSGGGSNTTSSLEGRGAEYDVARLKRDAETDATAAELVERVLDGELTPHAAAIQSGARKPRITVQASSPRLVANQLRKYMTPDQIAQLIALLLPDGLQPVDDDREE